ncbi:FecR family protein [Spirosoma endbachense]|uniref:DUF4974 domain-containing protein n=1 Tax=Spirosoma endbachense TaxID=2666025 RepID=A0A6P1W0F6_9BACT|nr:FecR family protein [Spirosoma endbachense]QHV97156.1 DUF4974 domain-containing protein [Spirosoma endbachense]
MTQQEFNELSERYLEGKTSEEEDRYLLAWSHRQLADELPDFTKVERSKVEKRIWRNVDQQIQPKIIWMRAAWLSGIAACLLMGLFWLVPSSLLPQNGPFAVANKLGRTGIEVKNTTSAEQVVKLEDGTVVLLKQKSSLVYGEKFNQSKREVYLTGEAFFYVKRDITKPFIVHSGTLITEVLGTSFRIKPKANAIEVAVATGRVSIYTEKSNHKNERAGIILTPNQQVTFDEASQNIIPGLVEKPMPITSVENIAPQLVFQSTPLQTVLNTLSTLYGIEFVITNPKTKDCHITADLNALSMFIQLELICKSIDATYEKRGTVIFINGEGC